ncbi:MAG: hypothetical protein H6767_09175 [Candidatus Peribacteria bacterium]|nr:MAG: hypothetical protein H6767_09175 [Candidatus Peribacteria bacterium]
MIAIGAIPLVMGLANLCVLKPKYIRILQIIFALLLFYFSGLMVDSPDLEIDTLYWIAGLFPLF